MVDPAHEPFDGPRALQEARRTLRRGGSLSITMHARQRMIERDMTVQDCLNVIQGGYCTGAEWAGTWRYGLQTARMRIVIAFDEDELILVTCMRLDP